MSPGSTFRMIRFSNRSGSRASRLSVDDACQALIGILSFLINTYVLSILPDLVLLLL